MFTEQELQDSEAIRAIRSIVIDATEQAGDGHPGAAISLSPVFYLLYKHILRVDSSDPSHPLRDRFVLSCGHTVTALYATLFMMGYGISGQDLKLLRRGGICPGHPELGVTPGIEMSTGPLGFGLSAAIGQAIALKKKFGVCKQSAPRVFVLASDGDLQEGVSLEAAELAAQLCLSNLVVVYDSNRVTIDGNTSPDWSASIPDRFRACGWVVFEVPAGTEGDIPRSGFVDQIRAAERSDKPAIVVVHTTIGFGVPELAGSPKIHGSVLGPRLASIAKKEVGFAGEPWSYLGALGDQGESSRDRLRSLTNIVTPNFSSKNSFQSDLSALYDALDAVLLNDHDNLRKTNGLICAALSSASEFVLTGSADLTESTGLPAPIGSNSLDNLSFGVREKAMAAAAVGLAREGFLPIFSTYLSFSDLQRIEVRMAALMQLPAVFLWTHDTFAIGPDGPTHQPIEQLVGLRAIPGFTVVRPASTHELRDSWRRIIGDSAPTGLVVSRSVGFRSSQLSGVVGKPSQGAYVVSDWSETWNGPRLVLLSCGSEVSLCLSAKSALGDEASGVRVVSVPAASWFWQQPDDYRSSVLPSEDIPRLVVEAGSKESWWRFATNRTNFLTIDHFGESDTGDNLSQKYGFTIEALTDRIKASF